MAATQSGSSQKGKKAPSTSATWKDEEVNTLIDIFSAETIQFSLEKAKCPKDKTAVYMEVKVKLENQGNSKIKVISKQQYQCTRKTL